MIKLTASRRKGFLHAVDAAIASLILALYTLSVVSIPAGTDWQTSNLRRSGQDIMWVMDDLGFIDQAMKTRNQYPIHGLVTVLNSDLGFKITASNFPPSFIKVGVVVSSQQTKNFTTTEKSNKSSIPGSQIPDADGDRYAVGTMSGYGNYPFIIYDGRFDNKSRFTHVTIDFNQNTFYQEYGEGPYHFRSRFICGNMSGPSHCDGDDVYEVGSFQKPVEEYLTIYPAEFSNHIDGRYTLNSINTSFSVDTINIDYEPDIENYDLILVQGVAQSYLNDYSGTFNDYLDQSGSIIELQELTILDSFHSQLGLNRYDYNLQSTGTSTEKYNTFHQANNASSTSHRVAKFFYGTPFHLDFFSDTQRLNGNLSNGWNVSSSMNSNSGNYMYAKTNLSGETNYFLLANDSSSVGYNKLYVSNSTDFTDSDTEYQPNDLIGASDSGFRNDYQLVNISYLKAFRAWRLILAPERPYKFRNYGQNQLGSDQPFIHMPNYDYDVSGEGWSWNYLDLEKWNFASPEKKGVPDFDCDPDTHLIGRPSDVSLPSEVNTMVLTDVKATSGSLSENCDDEYEYVQFDLNGDNKYNTSRREKIYQQNDTVMLDGKTYRVSFDSSFLHLIPKTPPAVETAVFTRNIRGKRGNYLNFPVDHFNPDDMSLLKAIIATTASRDVEVTLPRSSSGTEVSVTYTGAIDADSTTEYLPYTLSSSWWYQ